MTALPTNARIARLAGWTDLVNLGPRNHGGPGHTPGADLWVGRRPCVDCGGTRERTAHGITTPCLGCWWLSGYSYVPDHEHDWSAAGPIVERFRIAVTPVVGGTWSAEVDEYLCVGVCEHEPLRAHGSTPLAAICACVLALAAREEGK